MKRMILVLFCMLICSGCGKETSVKQSETSLNSDTIYSESADEENNTAAEMSSGMIGTVNDVTIEICGQQLAFPCKFGEFGENFRLENGYYVEEQDYTLYHLFHENEYICTIYLSGEIKNDHSETMVVGFDKRDLETNQFLIDGLGYDSQDAYIEHFGTPQTLKENYLEYVSERAVLAVFFEEDEDVSFPTSVVLLFTDDGK